MPWYFPWSDSIKKRACRYFLEHYLGQFLQEKLTLDQLTVDLFNGKGIVKRVPLDVLALNELLDGANVPLEILDGFIGTIVISVPWSSLMQENCELEVKGLEITVGVKHDVDYGGNVASESLAFSSMTSSLEIAQECLKGIESQDNEHTTTQQTFEGLELFAQTIESVLSRIKVSFQDVMIRFEHLFLNKKSGIALELHLQRIDYTDLSSDVSEGVEQPSHDVFEPPSLAQKHLRIFGLKLSLDEFHESSRTLLRNNLFNDQRSPSPENLTPSPPLSPYQSALFTQSLTTNLNELNLLPAIVILSSAGEQEARVTWKLNPSCPGPKVDFEYFIGTLNIFISPKQLHLLLEMINDLNNLQNTALGSYIHSQGVVNKPMKAEDFHKIEKGLHEQMLNERKQEIPPGKIDLRDICFENNHFHPLDSDKIVDETTEEETFFSLTENYPEVVHDATVKINGFPSSHGLVQRVSQAGIVPLSDQDEPNNDRRPSLPKFTGQNPGFAGISGLDDDTNNATKGLFKLSGLSITLLLKDPVRKHSVLKSETSSHDHPLCKIADRFFDQISSTAFGSKDLEQIQEKYNNACVESHLRCFFATVNISCELSNTSSCQSLTAETTVGLLKLVECLVKKTTDPPKHQLTELVNLSERSEAHQLNSLGKFVSASPCLKAKYKSIQRSCSPASIQGRHSVVPKTEVDIQLGDTELELDVTLLERLHDILCTSSGHEAQQRAPPPQYFTSGSSGSHINQQALFSRTMTDGSSCDQKTHIHVTCPNISASIRFPVPDLRRPDHRHIRSSMWKKSLRKEVCLLHCTDIAFEATLQGDENVTSYEVRFKNLNGYLQFYNDNKEPVPFLRISQRLNENDSDSNGFDLPRIIFRVQPSISGPLLEEASSGNDSPDSLSDTCSILKTEPSPFSSKPVMHNEEELVVPGDASEMKVFQEKTSLSSKLHLELNFPEIEINLHDQSFFEMIYNRFGNDLLLWEPFDSSAVHQPQFDVTVNNMIGLDFAARMTQSKFPPDSFKMCHSAMNNDSYSSDEGDSDSFEQRKTLNTIETLQSKIALTLNTSRAQVVLFPHSKNNNEDGLGKIMLRFDNAQLFFVLDYKGEDNLCYTSVQANYCSLHHGLMVDDMSSDMDTVFDSGHLYRTLYESDPRLKVTGTKCNVEECRPMFAVAVKSFLDTEKNAKDFVVAISLYGATLRHRVVHEGQMWLMQMVDFFCVTDEEIPGYVPPVVVTMLHVHFWNCAIHYRPLYIPYQLLITLEGFSVCSNIIADSKASILRFIIDNAVLLLSNNQEETMDLIKDYVSVGDVDLFELSLHTVSDVEKASPKLSLTLSNNIVHIRTCSDSLAALLDVIRYVANNGDFEKDATAVPACNSSSDDDKDEQFNDCPVEQRGPDAGSLHDLMSEAMVECNSNSNSNDKECVDDEATKDSKPSTSPKLDVFDFPGDSSVMTSQHDECGTTAASADHCTEDEGEDDDMSDDEFCILDHPQKEQEVIYDEPKVKCSGDEIKIVPDHFSVPLGGVDQLKAPSNYPTPLYCYTVKEMSVIWQLYGGRDFDENKNDKKKKKGRRNDSSCSGVENGVMLSVEDEIDEDPVIIDSRANKKKKAPQPRISWKTNAGVARDLNTLVEVELTKIRFQYEEYPEETKQAWRQVLLIQDVEIRDRLSSSQINKLLYQYSTEAKPKQTHANMVSIKILGLRPDVLFRSQEGCLRISLKPLKLNIDQDTLQFFIKFFKDLSNTDEINNQDACFENPSSSEVSSRPDSPVTPSNAEQATTNTPPIFFRLFEFSPEVPIRLDYCGKHMDMGQRSVASLLFAFAQLNCSEIRLRRLCQRSGLLGFDRVLSYAFNEWANDIKKTQIPSILGGVGPTYSFVQLIQGVKDLFWLPVEQYRRDGRIIRGLQRGASSFTTSSAMAFLELTNKLVQVVHGAAEVAYDMVSPETSSRGQAVKRRVSHQPADFRQGVANAYNVVTEGFGQTACNIVQVAMEEHENKGMTGAVGGVLRHIPSVVVQPIILATEATSNVLGGVRNQILPDARREATEKWRQYER